MQLMSSNQQLLTTFSRLISEYPDIRFAVAWASVSPVFELLKKGQSRIKRAVIGTHFYQTHPEVLYTFQGKSNVRFVLQPDGVFHPKLYLFQKKGSWEALIGSANLTSGALTTNSETMLLIGGATNDSSDLPDEISELIDHYWEMGSSVEDGEADAYNEVWKRKQQALRRLTGQYGTKRPSKPLTASSVMSMSWEQFFKAVQADHYHGFEQRCDLLQTVRKAFTRHPTFASMDLPTRKTIAGLPNDREGRWEA